MIGFTLSAGEQNGTFNLNNHEINFEIKYNSDFLKYYIDLYEDGDLVIGGRFLVNGCDILYNMKHLDLGKSLKFIGETDLSETYLIYEVS